jgi:DNA-binding GntR family transcriptional regulator
MPETTGQLPNEAQRETPPPFPAEIRPETSKTSLHDEVLTRLRDYIVEGNLEGGARIPERELCMQFSISRTPLREALKVLASEGLVDLLPNRGARVRVLDPKDYKALFDLMGGLEALAGRLACEAMNEAQFTEIEALHHEMYGFYLRRDLPEYFRCNQAIHQKIVAAAQNRMLAGMYGTVAGQIRRLRYAANRDAKHDRLSEAMREHEMILDALRRRAGVELSDILFMHLRNKQNAIEAASLCNL